MILPDTEGKKLISFAAFIEQLQLPEGTPGATKRDQVVEYLATQPESTMDGLLKRVLFSFDNGKLRGDVANKRSALAESQRQGGINGAEVAAGVGVGILSVAEILSSQYKVIFQGTEREFHCPLDMSDVVTALEVRFAHEIESEQLVLKTGAGGRLFFKNKAGEHLLTVILKSGQRDSRAYPGHPITTTVLKMSQANLELLEAKVLGGVNQVLDQAIGYADDNRISFFEGVNLVGKAWSAATSVAKTGGIGIQVLGVIAQELDKAEEAYKVTRDNQIDKSVDDAKADKAQRQCMFCGVERLVGEVSCTRCGGAYEPAKKH